MVNYQRVFSIAVFLFFFATVNPSSNLLGEAKLPEKIVLSVMYFDNNSKTPSLDWLRKGLADMIITDISKTKQIQIVQRENLQKVLTEQKLALSGLIDKNSAVKVGELLGANVILMGSFAKIENKIRVDGQLVNAENAEIINTATVTGYLSDVLYLEKKFSVEILKLLGAELNEKEEVKLKQMDTENLDAAKYNYQGINALDENQIALALEYFQKATQIDPDYKTAREHYTRFSRQVSGEGLFAEAFQQLEDKTKFVSNAKSLLKTLANEILNNGFEIELGKPSVTTDLNDAKTAIVKMNVVVTFRKEVFDYLKTVMKTLGGKIGPEVNSYGIQSGFIAYATYAKEYPRYPMVDSDKEREYHLNKFFSNLLTSPRELDYWEREGLCLKIIFLDKEKKLLHEEYFREHWITTAPFRQKGLTYVPFRVETGSRPCFFFCSSLAKSSNLEFKIPIIDAKKVFSIEAKVVKR